MTSGPKRPWFRFHLLTAVLMMIAAGSLVGTNMRDRGDGTHGWPCCMHYPLIFLDSEEATIEIGEKVRGKNRSFRDGTGRGMCGALLSIRSLDSWACFSSPSSPSSSSAAARAASHERQAQAEVLAGSSKYGAPDGVRGRRIYMVFYTPKIWVYATNSELCRALLGGTWLAVSSVSNRRYYTRKRLWRLPSIAGREGFLLSTKLPV